MTIVCILITNPSSSIGSQCTNSISLVFCRVVNIAVSVSPPLLLAILLGYWHDYCRYFSSILFVRSIEMGIGDTFSAIFWQYSIPVLLSASNAAAAAARWRPKHNNAGVCPLAWTVHRAGRRKLHAMDTRAWVLLLQGWKNKCRDSHNRLRNVCCETRPRATVQLTLRTFALRVIAQPLLTQHNYCRQLSTTTRWRALEAAFYSNCSILWGEQYNSRYGDFSQVLILVSLVKICT